MYRYIDRPLVLMSLLLIWIGTASIYSATNFDLDFLVRQLNALIISLIAFILLVLTPSEKIQSYAKYGLVFTLVTGITVLIIGRDVNGARRWISIGALTIHTGEIIKLFACLYLASYISRHRDRLLSKTSGVYFLLFIFLIICLLLLRQPDFGAAVVLMVAALGTLFLAGVPLLSFTVILIMFILGSTFLAISQPYRLQRISSFIDPWSDPFSSGYQLTQSLIAFGRGELLGVGYGESLQKLGYLPEAHHDFIFAVFSEELGAIAGIVLMLMLLFVAYRVLLIGSLAIKAGSWFAGCVAYFTAISLAASTLISVGVNIGALPTKGLTLPFISYGRNSLVVTVMLIALVIRMDLERKAGTLPVGMDAVKQVK